MISARDNESTIWECRCHEAQHVQFLRPQTLWRRLKMLAAASLKTDTTTGQRKGLRSQCMYKKSCTKSCRQKVSRHVE